MITLYQHPNKANTSSVPLYPHSKTGTIATTFASDNFDISQDFMFYVVITNHKDNKSYKNLIPPLNDSGMTYYNIVQTVKDIVWYDYNPEVTTIKNSDNNITSYDIDIYEFYDNTIHTSTKKSQSCVVGNLIDNLYNNDSIDQINIAEYINNSSTSKFLTKVTKKMRFKENDKASWKAYNFNQNLPYISPTIDQIKYIITKSNGTIYTCHLDNNIPKTTIGTTMTGATIEFPIGPANFSNLYVEKIELPNGYTFYPNAYYTISFEDGDEYTIYSWDNTNSAKTSQDYNFEVYCDKNDFLVSWENSLGGTDYFNFSKKYKKTISINPKYYEKNKYDWRDNIYYDRVYKKGTTIYENDYKEIYTLHSPWLTIDEVNTLENLFYSENIEVCIDNKWYSALANKKTAEVIQDKSMKMRLLTFELVVDKNKNLN